MERGEWRNSELGDLEFGLVFFVFWCFIFGTLIVMGNKKLSFYEILVYAAWGYFLLLGLLWFGMSLWGGHQFNAEALFIVVAFAAQFYFKHRLTNLILGILALFFSIWMLLDVFSSFDLMAKSAHIDGLSGGLMAFCFFSMIMSVVLIFGYTKLSFKDI